MATRRKPKGDPPHISSSDVVAMLQRARAPKADRFSPPSDRRVFGEDILAGGPRALNFVAGVMRQMAVERYWAEALGRPLSERLRKAEGEYRCTLCLEIDHLNDELLRVEFEIRTEPQDRLRILAESAEAERRALEKEIERRTRQLDAIDAPPIALMVTEQVTRPLKPTPEDLESLRRLYEMLAGPSRVSKDGPASRFIAEAVKVIGWPLMTTGAIAAAIARQKEATTTNR